MTVPLLSKVPRKTKLALPPLSGVNNLQAYGVWERSCSIWEESSSFSTSDRDIISEEMVMFSKR